MNEIQNEQAENFKIEETVIQYEQAEKVVDGEIARNKKLKKCQICEKFIAKNAKRCPNCGAKNKKKYYQRKRFWLLIIIVLIVIINSIPKNEKSRDDNSNITTTEKIFNYTDVYVGDTIRTDFVTISIDDVYTTDAIYSIDSSAALKSDGTEIYVCVTGTIINTSSSSYDLGSMGSNAYGATTGKIDADLLLNNGNTEYGSLLVDNGSWDGILADGYLASYDEVKYYIVFMMDESTYNLSNTGEITLAFTDNFLYEPEYDKSNCQYLYRTNY